MWLSWVLGTFVFVGFFLQIKIKIKNYIFNSVNININSNSNILIVYIKTLFLTLVFIFFLILKAIKTFLWVPVSWAIGTVPNVWVKPAWLDQNCL